MSQSCLVTGVKERSSSLAQIIAAANAVVPGYRLPPPAPSWLLWAVAWAPEVALRGVLRYLGER